MMYAELRAHWYRRLRESGFRDIEACDPERNSLAYALALGPAVRQANAEYYALAAEYLATAEFPTTLEQAIWELHTDGQTVREIARVVGCTRMYVQRRVARHRREALGTNRTVAASPGAES